MFAEKYPGTPDLFVVRSEINDVLPLVEHVGNSGDEKKDLIEKAAYLMANISWLQPFGEGNKRAGLIAATKFLSDNGYDLDLSSKDDQKELRILLYRIQEQRVSLDRSVVKQIIFYISKRIVKHEPR